MRLIALAVLIGSVAAMQAAAQEKSWTPAPVPSVGNGNTLQPAARAGSPVTDDHTTPFSSVPSGSVAGDGATSPNRVNGVGTPNLSK